MANVLAGLSLLLSLSLGVFYLLDRNHNKFLLESEYTNSILQWHKEVIFILKKLDINDREMNSDEYQNDLAELSALIDQGRFFFPNIKKDNFGAKNPVAYRGFRNLALDFLVASYKLYSSPSTLESRKDAEILQRHFTSIVFEIVNPDERLSKIQKLTDRYFLKEESFENFIQDKDGDAIRYIWKTD